MTKRQWVKIAVDDRHWEAEADADEGGHLGL